MFLIKSATESKTFPHEDALRAWLMKHVVAKDADPASIDLYRKLDFRFDIRMGFGKDPEPVRIDIREIQRAIVKHGPKVPVVVSTRKHPQRIRKTHRRAPETTTPIAGTLDSTPVKKPRKPPRAHRTEDIPSLEATKEPQEAATIDNPPPVVSSTQPPTPPPDAVKPTPVLPTEHPGIRPSVPFEDRVAKALVGFGGKATISDLTDVIGIEIKTHLNRRSLYDAVAKAVEDHPDRFAHGDRGVVRLAALAQRAGV